jgi:hypothetical protein
VSMGNCFTLAFRFVYGASFADSKSTTSDRASTFAATAGILVRMESD